MAAIFYPSGRTAFAQGDIAWTASATNLKAVLVNTGAPNYVYSAAHTSLADATAGVRVSTSIITPLDPSGGSVRANQIAFNGLSGLQSSQAMLIYEEGANATASPLLAYFDLNVPANSNSIQVTFTNSNKVIAVGGNV